MNRKVTYTALTILAFYFYSCSSMIRAPSFEQAIENESKLEEITTHSDSSKTRPDSLYYLND